MPGRGGLIGLVGKGVGLAAEYREHRKEQRLSRENSQQDTSTVAGSSSRSQVAQPQLVSSSDLPPAYSDVANGRTERSVATGNPASTDKKAALAQYEDQDSSSDDDLSSIEDDEEDWQLDEALERSKSGELPSYDESEVKYVPVDDLVRDVMVHNHPVTGPTFVRTPLPCPVILPQRRPRKKARGFVHAYAPLLGECSGIDQETFISFLDNFYKSSQASPIFPIIQVSAMIAGFAPSVIAMAVTTAVQVAARTGQEIQSRHRTNDFLDKMNDELFKPAGLYAMIIKYKTDQEVIRSGSSILAKFGVSSEIVDLNTSQAIAKYNRTLSDESNGQSMSDRMKNIRLASGTTKGTIRLPEAAPLIFPDVDKAIAKDGPETFKDKTKDAKNFLSDYMDRRAQMAYAQDDPNSALKVPESQRAMKSKLSDPHHPMFNNGLIGFASGGYLTPRQAKRRRRFERDEKRALRYEQQMDSGRGLSGKQQRRYDGIVGAQEYHGVGSYGGRSEYESGGYGRGRPGFGGPRRSGGPIGLVTGLIGGAVRGSRGSSNDRSREYEDAYNTRQAPYGNEQTMRRSFDDRSNAPASHAPHGGQSYGSNAPAAHAPYGGQQSYSSTAHTSYGDAGSYSRRDHTNYRRGNGPLGMVRRVMTEDVLYLMIVNMPTEAELTEAQEALAKAKNEK